MRLCVWQSQIIANERYASVALFIIMLYNLVLTFPPAQSCLNNLDSVDEIRQNDHSDESYRGAMMLFV